MNHVAIINDVMFPSDIIRNLIYRGNACHQFTRKSRILETMGWLEKRFAQSFYSHLCGEPCDMRMTEVELIEVYIHSGAVETLREITGSETLSAEDLLQQISAQIQQASSRLPGQKSA